MNTHVAETREFEAGHDTGALRDGRRPGLVEWWRERYEGYRDWIRYRAAVRELSMMDDSRLADIGVDRSEIRSVIRQAMVDKQERRQRGGGVARRLA